MTTAFATLLSKLTGVTGTGNNRKAKCPAHNDNVASLSVTDGDDRVVLHCHAGCEPEAVVSAMGLTFADLFPSKVEPLQIIAMYDYRALDGTLLYQSVRFFPKEFRQRRPDGNGKWLWDMQPLKVHVEHKEPLRLGTLPPDCELVEGEFWRREIARHDRRRLAFALWSVLSGRLLGAAPAARPAGAHA